MQSISRIHTPQSISQPNPIPIAIPIPIPGNAAVTAIIPSYLSLNMQFISQ